QVAQQKALMEKKIVRAPFAGRLGLRAVDLGQYLGSGAMIVTLQALDPIYVDFYLPQQALDQIKVGQTVTLRIDAFPKQGFPGQIAAIDPKVDAGTRNLQIRAAVKNLERKLLPGMFATVTIATGAPQHQITLPQTAITFNPYGSTVYLT